MSAAQATDAFQESIAHPDDRIVLPEAALLIARDEYPDLPVAAYLRRLEEIAAGAGAAAAGAEGNPFAVIDALNSHLFGTLGFRGNQDDYFDPRNSYLNDVLDRRLGIPLTLSIVYLEAAAGAGFPLRGIGFPGHFLVQHASHGREILIDPFHRGAILLPEDCRARLRQAYGAEVPLEEGFFRPVGKRAILARMLHNLKHIHLRREDYPRALRAIEKLMLLTPRDPGLRRDRGFVHLKMERPGRAAEDLEAYLALQPEADDAEEARRRIRAIRRDAALHN
ncbi:MAG TPA: transglutaminase-like domain-containing protein [Candidatus Polarisedimenticolia bacterium]|nr:transglutaminase-like domain-containing protein [Candidatus Polarisedimenticolia bacterium]